MDSKKPFKVFDKITADDELKQKTLDYLGDTIKTGGRQPRKNRRMQNYSLRFAMAVLVVAVMVGGFFVLNSGTGDINSIQGDAMNTSGGANATQALPSPQPTQSNVVAAQPDESAVAYLDIDVNPSIELALDSGNRVISSRAYNEEGELILAGTNIDGKLYDDAVKALVADMIAAGYLEKGGLVSLTLQAEGDSESPMLSSLNGAVQSVLDETDTQADVDIYPVSSEVKQQAHSHSMTPARYLAITELQQLDSTATYEGCSGHSLSEIHHMAQQIRECENGNHADCEHSHGSQNENGEGQNNGSQNGHHGGH